MRQERDRELSHPHDIRNSSWDDKTTDKYNYARNARSTQDYMALQYGLTVPKLCFKLIRHSGCRWENVSGNRLAERSINVPEPSHVTHVTLKRGFPWLPTFHLCQARKLGALFLNSFCLTALTCKLSPSEKSRNRKKVKAS